MNVLDVPCPRCHAPAGKPCDRLNKRTGAVRRLRRPHLPRVRAAFKLIWSPST